MTVTEGPRGFWEKVLATTLLRAEQNPSGYADDIEFCRTKLAEFHDITLYRNGRGSYWVECSCGFESLHWNIMSRPGATKAQAAHSGSAHLYDAGVTRLTDGTLKFKEEKKDAF